MNDTNAIPYLDRILKANDQLLGLPALPLLFIACLAAGYCLKSIPCWPNRYIPLGVFLTGVLGNILLALGTLAGNRQVVIAAIARQAFLGLIAAAAAWLVHNKWLRKFENGTPIALDSGDKPAQNGSQIP